MELGTVRLPLVRIPLPPGFPLAVESVTGRRRGAGLPVAGSLGWGRVRDDVLWGVETDGPAVTGTLVPSLSPGGEREVGWESTEHRGKGGLGVKTFKTGVNGEERKGRGTLVVRLEKRERDLKH